MHGHRPEHGTGLELLAFHSAFTHVELHPEETGFSSKTVIATHSHARLKQALVLVFASLFSCPSQATPAKYALATSHPRATEAGGGILDTGGNAFDAAVTVAAMLAVVQPYSSGIGGGGFWLLRRAEDNAGNGVDLMLDGRERAPSAAHRDMFLDENGHVVPGRSVNGALAAGIPGLPAAIARLAKDYGRLPLSTTLAPAITAAKQGFAADDRFIRMLRARIDAVRASPAAADVFLVNGRLPEPGQLIRQPGLAEVLQRIATQGKNGFYRGETADALVRGVVAAGGIWQKKDLADYEVATRKPVRFSYQGARFVGASPPSSGGIVMAEIFNVLSQFDLAEMNPIGRTHYLAEAMRLAYRDRARHLGDPDFVHVPEELTTLKYARNLARTIGETRAVNAANGADAPTGSGEGRNTTHYSIIDREGNLVAATLSINYAFGSGVIVSGVLLNNEMDDFVAKPGVPNLYGLVGGDANSIEPGKRMLSSMSPTFIDDGQRVAVLGTPGGSRIITMVTLAALKFLEGADAATIVSAKRFHHQYLPDTIQFEPRAFSPDAQKQLRAKGHKLTPLDNDYGDMQIVIRDYRNNTLDAASDPRGLGSVRSR